MDIFTYKDPKFTVKYTKQEHVTSQPMHTHSFAELYCFLGGNATFHIEGMTYALQPGYILLMRPGEAHYAEVEPHTPYEQITINFDPELLEALEPGNTLLRPFFERRAGRRNRYHTDPVCTGYCLAMAESGGSRATILANLVLLLQALCRRFDKSAEQIAALDSVEYWMIRYINENLCSQLPVEELCARFYLSRPQLSRRFREATGTSIGRYITAKRMLLARQLLLQGKKPTQVFAGCGYRDYATFFRAYKAYFGHSPRETACIPIAEERHIIE